MLYVEFSLILSCMVFVLIFVIPFLRERKCGIHLLHVLRACAVLSLSLSRVDNKLSQVV